MSAIVQTYLNLLDSQRESVFSALEGLTDEQIWQRPAPNEWSIGEILDHNRVIFESTLQLFKINWALTSWYASLRRKRPYPVEIRDVYRDPGFPMKVGWLWPPRKKPAPLEQIKAEIRATHQETRAFYESRPADILGNGWMYDPVVGWVNYITALRVGIFHDQLHFDDVLKLAAQCAPCRQAPANGLSIRRAHSGEAAALTDIALAAKRYWGYPDKWIKIWTPLLTITPEFITANETYTATMNDKPVAFYAVSVNGERASLDHMWVHPQCIGKGIGRELFAHSLSRARALGANILEVEADPHAQGFYEKMGAHWVGKHIGDVSGQVRTLPVLEINL